MAKMVRMMMMMMRMMMMMMMMMVMMMVFFVIEKVPDADANFQHSHATCKQPTAQTIVHTLPRLNKRVDLFFVEAVYNS